MSTSMKRTMGLAGLVLLLAVVIGVGATRPGTDRPDALTADHRTVIDSTGAAVRVPSKPRRIVSLCTTATDTLVRLGMVDRLAAIDNHGDVVPGTEDVRRLGRAAALGREVVLSMEADLAFAWWYQDDAVRVLQEAGTPVVRLRCSRAADVPETIELVARCAGVPGRGQELSNSVQQYLDSASTDTPDTSRPGVYVELYGPFKTMGHDTYLDDLLRLAGGRNIARGAAGSVLLSPEHLLVADPEVILFVDEFTSVDRLADRSGLNRLSALRTGNVHGISRYTLVAGAGLPEAVDRLRHLIHEE